ncbi:hypothetical protein [Caulobacter segnis]
MARAQSTPAKGQWRGGAIVEAVGDDLPRRSGGGSPCRPTLSSR